MERILVIQTAFIGDAILGTALLEKIHSDHPQAKIDYLIRKGNESLFKGHPFINELLVWDKNKRKYLDLFRLMRSVRASQYDLVLNIQRYAASGILTALSGATETVGYKSNPLSFAFSRTILHRFGKGYEDVHEVERVIDFWKTGSEDKGRPRLYPTETDHASVSKYKTVPYITVAPASVWFTKQFPNAKWAEFINGVPEELKVILIGSPSDRTVATSIADAVEREVLDLTGDLSLLQTTALMKDARMNFANDSAPVHLASAINAPMCEVFCSTVPEFGFVPLSDNSHIVQTNELLDCRPCGMHGSKTCHKGHFRCATTINVVEMLDKLKV